MNYGVGAPNFHATAGLVVMYEMQLVFMVIMSGDNLFLIITVTCIINNCSCGYNVLSFYV